MLLGIIYVIPKINNLNEKEKTHSSGHISSIYYTEKGLNLQKFMSHNSHHIHSK